MLRTLKFLQVISNVASGEFIRSLTCYVQYQTHHGVDEVLRSPVLHTKRAIGKPGDFLQWRKVPTASRMLCGESITFRGYKPTL